MKSMAFRCVFSSLLMAVFCLQASVCPGLAHGITTPAMSFFDVNDSLVLPTSRDNKLFQELFGGEYTDIPRSNSDSLEADIFRDAGYISLLAMGVCGVLYVAPEGISRWDKNEKDLNPGKIGGRYWQHVTGGPVVDKDKFLINYVGHPYFGSVYYVRARHRNRTPLQSLAYSFLMSTFVYENGLEAIFEKPSLQDIIVTPLFGSMLGELSLKFENMLYHQDQEFFGSRMLGGLCLFLIDPLGNIIEPASDYFENSLNLRVRKEFVWRSSAYDADSFADVSDSSSNFIYGIKFVFYRVAP